MMTEGCPNWNVSHLPMTSLSGEVLHEYLGEADGP